MIFIDKSLAKSLIKYRIINWLLVFTITVPALLPAHFHLHSLQHNAYHQHEMASVMTAADYQLDVHVLADADGHRHHDQLITTIPVSPDGIVKKIDTGIFPFILFLLISQLLPVVYKQISSRYRAVDRKQQTLFYYTPLLRAPPQI